MLVWLKESRSKIYSLLGLVCLLRLWYLAESTIQLTLSNMGLPIVLFVAVIYLDDAIPTLFQRFRRWQAKRSLQNCR